MMRSRKLAHRFKMANPEIQQAVALVIGGSYGIGEGVSKRLAKDGNIVVIASRDEGRAQPVLESIRREGGKASWVQCDATSEEDVQRAVGIVRSDSVFSTLISFRCSANSEIESTFWFKMRAYSQRFFFLLLPHPVHNN